ncbi:hypothetical protein D9M70_252780 [compost metagenome]
MRGDADVAGAGAEVRALLDVGARLDGDVACASHSAGRSAGDGHVAGTGLHRDVAAAGRHRSVLNYVLARLDGDIAGAGDGVGSAGGNGHVAVGCLQRNVAGDGQVQRVLRNAAACREGDVAIARDDHRVLRDVVIGSQRDIGGAEDSRVLLQRTFRAESDVAATQGDHHLVHEQRTAVRLYADVATGRVQAKRRRQSQIRRDATDGEIAVQIGNFHATAAAAGDQAVGADVQRLAFADAAAGGQRQVGGGQVGRAVVQRIADGIGRHQGDGVGSGASGDAADVQRTTAGQGDVAGVGFHHTDAEVVLLGDIDFAMGRGIHAAHMGVERASGIGAGAADGAGGGQAQFVGDDLGGVVVVVVDAAARRQVDAVAGGAQAANGDVAGSIDIDVAVSGRQAIHHQFAGFADGEVADAGDLRLQTDDLAVQFHTVECVHHQGAALHVALLAVAVDDRAAAGQGHGVGLVGVADQLLDAQRTVGVDADVAVAGNAVHRAFAGDGQQLAVVAVDDVHTGVAGRGGQAIDLGVHRGQVADAVVGLEQQVRGEQLAAGALDGIAGVQADRLVAVHGADQVQVLVGAGDDLLAGGHLDVAEADAAGGVEEQVGVQRAALVHVQAVGSDAQRLVGGTVDVLVQVIGAHRLLAHLLGGIARHVGLEHGEVGHVLRGLRGVADGGGHIQVGLRVGQRGSGHIELVVQVVQRVLARRQGVALVAVQRQGGGGQGQVDHGEGGIRAGVARERNRLGGAGDDGGGVAHHGGGIQRGIQDVDIGRSAVHGSLRSTLLQGGQAFDAGGQGLLQLGLGHHLLVALQLLLEDFQLQQLGGGLGHLRRILGDGGVAVQLGVAQRRGAGLQGDVVAADVLRAAIAVDDDAVQRTDPDVAGGAGIAEGIEHADGDVRLCLQLDIAAVGLQVAGDDHAAVAVHLGLRHGGQGDAAAARQVDGVALVEEDDVAGGGGHGQLAAVHGDGAAVVVEDGDAGGDDGDFAVALAGQRLVVDGDGTGVGRLHAAGAARGGEEADVEVEVAVHADAARGTHVQRARGDVGLALVAAGILDAAAGLEHDIVAAGVDRAEADAAVRGNLDVAAAAAGGGLHQAEQLAAGLAGVDAAVDGIDHQVLYLDLHGLAAFAEGLGGSVETGGDEVDTAATVLRGAGDVEGDRLAGLQPVDAGIARVAEGDLAAGIGVQQADVANVGKVDIATAAGQAHRPGDLGGECAAGVADGGAVQVQRTGRDMETGVVRRAFDGAAGGEVDRLGCRNRIDQQCTGLLHAHRAVGAVGAGLDAGLLGRAVVDVDGAVAAGQVQPGAIGDQRGIGGTDVVAGIQGDVPGRQPAAALADVAGGGQLDAVAGAGIDAGQHQGAGAVAEGQVQRRIERELAAVAVERQLAAAEVDLRVAVGGLRIDALQRQVVLHIDA